MTSTPASHPSRVTSLDPIVNLAKRRGLFFNSAELYNGAGGLFDYGPLGVELLTTIRKRWWRRFVYSRDDIVGVDAAILTPAPILKASGHVDSFSDPLVECTNCHIRLRADHYLEEDEVHIWIERWTAEAARQRGIHQKAGEPVPSKADQSAALEAAQALYDFSTEPATRQSTATHADLTCPNPECRKKAFTLPKQFNMMFGTYLGPVADEASVVYLRPETAQGIFTNYKNILDTYHQKLPFGVAQIGKAFRNEITTGNSLFRMREFRQMEIEYFVKPGAAPDLFDGWLAAQEAFLTDDLGVNRENLRQYEHPAEKRSHYSSRTVDWEYDYPFGGWGELTGLANRTDYDLRQHQEASGVPLTYFDEATRDRYLPHVLEPTFGLDRCFLTVLVEHYREYPQGRDGQGSELETVLHLPAHLAPVAVAVLPLMKKDGLPEKAHEVLALVKQALPDRLVAYEETGAIGRRYRKQDEIGTPYCITIDHQTLEDGTVTLRNRDSMQQERHKISNLGHDVRSVL